MKSRTCIEGLFAGADGENMGEAGTQEKKIEANMYLVICKISEVFV